jgi:hypothetical protein
MQPVASLFSGTGPMGALGRSYRETRPVLCGLPSTGILSNRAGLLDLKNAVVNSTLLTQIIAGEECKVVFSYRIKNFLHTANATTDAGTYQHTSYRR